MKNFLFKLFVFALRVIAIPFGILSLLLVILQAFTSFIVGLLCYRNTTDALYHVVYMLGGSERF